jgi:arginase
MKQPRAVSTVTKQLASDVADVAEGGKLPLTLGGDHSLVSLTAVVGGASASTSADRAVATPRFELY